MSNYVWTYKDWGARFPSFGSDELYRHTLVIPNPFKVNSVDEEDGTKYRPALVMVVAPWWFCRHIFDAEHRRDARQARADYAVFEAEMEAEDAAALEAAIKEAQEPRTNS